MRRSSAVACAILGLTALLAGCFYVPNLKKTVEPAEVDRVEVGRTTLDDATGRFGEPDARVDEHLLVYEFRRTRGWVVLAGGYSASATGVGSRRVRLMLEFDPQGLLARFHLETNLEKYEDLEDAEQPDRGLPDDRARSAQGCEDHGPILTVRHEGARVRTGHLEGQACTWDAATLEDPVVARPFTLDPRDRGAFGWRGAEPDLTEYYFKKGMATRLVAGLSEYAAQGGEGPVLIPELWPVAQSGDGAELATGDERGSVTLWNVATGRSTLTLSLGTQDAPPVEPALFGEPLRVPVGALAFAPHRRLLAASWIGGATALFDLERDRVVGLPGGGGVPKLERRALAFSSDGRLLAVGGCLHVELWRVAPAIEGAEPIAAGDRIGRAPATALATSLLLPAVGDGICRPMLCFSADDRRLAAASNGTVSVWDLADGRRTALIESTRRGTLDIALDPHGTSLAIADDRGLRLWDLDAGE